MKGNMDTDNVDTPQELLKIWRAENRVVTVVVSPEQQQQSQQNLAEIMRQGRYRSGVSRIGAKGRRVD